MKNLQKLAALAKVLSSGFGPDGVGDLFASLGCQVEFQELQAGQYPLAFQSAAKTAMRPNAQVLAIHGRDSDGNAVEALMVFASQPQLSDGEGTQKIVLDKPGELIIT